MKKKLLIFIVLLNFASFAQEDAIVYFKDKPNSAVFLANPLTMLTQRAIDRRTNQNIPIVLNDVPMHQPYYDQINAATGITLLAKSKWMNCVYVRGLEADISALETLSFVDNVKFLDNTLNRTTSQQTNSTSTRNISQNKLNSMNVTYDYGNSFSQISMMNGHILHQQNFTGTGKIIAVLDSGFPNVDTAQPFQRLITNNQILGGYNFVDRTNNYFSAHNHGTNVLSCMGGFVDGQLVGTAPDAQYYLYVTEDVSSENPVEEANWVEAAEEADRVGADIITSSLGYFGYDYEPYSHVYADMTGDKNFSSKGVNIAFSKGIIVVASAGNAGGQTEPHVGAPAEATNALAIGAVKSDRLRASFSSIGPSFDGRIKPDIMAQGQASVISSTSGNITTANGTSFSGPILAGMVASFWQAVPTLTNQQVVDLVKQSADNFATPNEFYGYGIPNFQSALSLSNVNFENFTRNSFAITPNPIVDQIEVLFPNGFNKATLSFFNILGQNVSNNEITSTNKTINTNGLSSGVYIYKIESNNLIQTGKIIKN